MNLFPIFVKLAGRKCLVIGAGAVAEQKIEGLLSSGASVRVVAPEATGAIRRWHDEGRVSWQAREFANPDLDGIFLVVAATASRPVNQAVFVEAQRLGVLCNVVDVPELCDFYYPSVVRRGRLQIAISTDGQSPALAQRIRKQLEERFGPEYESWLEHLGQWRLRLFARRMDPERRRRALHLLASQPAFERYLRRRKGAR
jgi:precorrin-2 dehydrogenase/sirohydrochlorin ferrochelatase